MIGSLMWLYGGTRPDIGTEVGTLSRFCARPGPAHFGAVTHLFRYPEPFRPLQTARV